MHILTLLVTGSLTLVAGYFGLYVFVLPHIFIHEVGHWIAGHLCELQLVRFRVGPLEFSRPGILQAPGPIKWKWHWSWKYFWSGAIVMQATRDAMTRTRVRYAIYTLGGVIANIGSGLLALPVAMHKSSIGGYGTYFVLGSALLGISNLIPFRAQSLGFDSDGKQLLILMTNKRKSAALLYWFTLAARLQEISELWRSGRATEACQKSDAFMRESEHLEMSAEYRRRLDELNAIFQKALSGQLSNS